MLLENLYRVFLDNQVVALRDATSDLIIWVGLVRNIPTEYLSCTVTHVMSCVSTKFGSKILISIA